MKRMQEINKERKQREEKQKVNLQKELENNAFPSEKDREMIIIRLEEI